MKFISIREFRNQSALVQKILPQERDVIVTSNGKPIAILSSISETSLEETLKALKQIRVSLAIQKMQQQSAASGLDQISLKDINAEIAKVRKKRKRA